MPCPSLVAKPWESLGVSDSPCLLPSTSWLPSDRDAETFFKEKVAWCFLFIFNVQPAEKTPSFWEPKPGDELSFLKCKGFAFWHLTTCCMHIWCFEGFNHCMHASYPKWSQRLHFYNSSCSKQSLWGLLRLLLLLFFQCGVNLTRIFFLIGEEGERNLPESLLWIIQTSSSLLMGRIGKVLGYV